VIPAGASVGTCAMPTNPPPVDGGNPPGCALYGQTCSDNGDCCDGVPCTAGRCRYP
jgi:hypothetical protein